MDQLRQEGNEDGYTVSFELGTVSRRIGVSLQELTENTTIGLYKDLEDDDDDDNAERKDGSADDNMNNSSDVSEGKEDGNDACSICQEKLLPFSIIRQIERCEHFFHQECIEKWLGEHTTCPLCMQQISSADNDDFPQTADENPLPTQTEQEHLSQQERILNMVAVELGI